MYNLSENKEVGKSTRMVVLHERYLHTLTLQFAGLVKVISMEFYYFCYLLHLVKPQRSNEPTSLEEQVIRGFLVFQLPAEMLA